MTTITIKAVANTSLYRDIQAGINRHTTHRTLTGALRGLISMDRKADRWAASCGQWGRIVIEIDGEPVDSDTTGSLLFDITEARSRYGRSDAERSALATLQYLVDHVDA